MGKIEKVEKDKLGMCIIKERESEGIHMYMYLMYFISSLIFVFGQSVAAGFRPLEPTTDPKIGE